MKVVLLSLLGATVGAMVTYLALGAGDPGVVLTVVVAAVVGIVVRMVIQVVRRARRRRRT